ncbi:MAG: glycoside hydrolase family 13 protein [Firmicutes bacterium]|nr:glycoside hydrolase family 13 protein [Bacillota bacterium]
MPAIPSIPLSALAACEKISLLARLNGAFPNFEAVFSDETHNFVTPCEPRLGEEVTVRLRAGKNNASAARLCYGGSVMDMTRTASDGLFDYYTASFRMTGKKINYYFKLSMSGSEYFYNKRGLYRDLAEGFNFTLVADFATPDWAAGAVIYQIFVDRFRNGDLSNDVLTNEYIYLGQPSRRADWGEDVPARDVCNFYGGDLKGVMEKMAYLKELGVEAVYFNPLFVSPSSHKYDIQDYDYVDPHFGAIPEDGGDVLSQDAFKNRNASKYVARTARPANLEASNRLLAELIGLAHANGIRVILDGVFNHCGAFNKWMDRENFYQSAGYPPGAYRDEKSPYHDYFKWYDDNWPNNDCYDSWWGHDNHPKLYYEKSRALYDYMITVGAKWVSPPFSADGWRLDVAADLGASPEMNHRFWRDFRKAVKKANPEAVIIAEHYGDPAAWLEGDQWDSVMNYDAFMEPITWFLTGMEKHSEAFRGEMLRNAMAFEEAMRFHMSRMGSHATYTAMNELSNHDHSRFLTRTNMTPGRLHTLGARAAGQNVNPAVMMEAVVFQMTWPGCPAIYYGDEAGLCGWTDPDNRRPFPWGAEDKTLLRFHRDLIRVRKRFRAFRTGSLEYLYTNYGVLTYGRWDADERLVVALNNNPTAEVLRIPVWKIGCSTRGKMETLICASGGGYALGGADYEISDGQVTLEMPPFGAALMKEELSS